MTHKSSCIVGCGFIGRHLLQALLDNGYKVSVIDRIKRPTWLPDHVIWHQMGSFDHAGVTSILNGVDVVYYLVSTTVPADKHLSLTAELYETIVATTQFIDCAKEASVKKLIFASSASVYGDLGPVAAQENAQTNPISAHGIQKLTLEKHLLMERHLGAIDTQTFRIANPYGPGQSLEGRQGFIAIVLGNVIAGRATDLRGDGSAMRDFIYVTEVAQALAQIGMQLDGPPTVNIGSAEAVTMAQVIDAVDTLCGQRPVINSLPAQPHEIGYSCMDIRVAQSCGWQPKISLQEGLKRTMRFHNMSVL